MCWPNTLPLSQDPKGLLRLRRRRRRSSSFVVESVGAGVLTKHPPLEPGPEGNYHLILKGNYHLTLKVDIAKGIIILLLKLSYISPYS